MRAEFVRWARVDPQAGPLAVPRWAERRGLSLPARGVPADGVIIRRCLFRRDTVEWHHQGRAAFRTSWRRIADGPGRVGPRLEDSVFPFIDTAPRAARPVVTLAFIAVNTLVFLWMRSLPPRTLNWVLVHAALIPAIYTEPGVARSAGLDPSNWWPLLTNTFMHGGWLHLISNMWFLWIFGPAMEARFGRLGYAVLYLAGALAASSLHLLTHPDSTEPVIGASGAIAAVIGAYALTYPTARVVTVILLVFIPLLLPIPALLFAIIWFVLQLLQGSLELMSPDLAPGVAWWAHIGGFGFGALFATIANGIGTSSRIPTTRWNRPAGRHRVPNIRPRRWDP